MEASGIVQTGEPASSGVGYARHYPHFVAQLGAAGRRLPRHVQREFEEYLKCGRLEHGFLRLRCEACHAEKLVAFSCQHPGHNAE
jgi:Transposase zinc-binding domain